MTITDTEKPLTGKRVTYLLEAPHRVGANLQQQMLALRELGAHVTALFMTGNPADYLASDNVTAVAGLGLPKSALSGMRLRLARRLRRELMQTSTDILVCDQYKAVTAAALATTLPMGSRPRVYGLLRGFFATDSRSRQRVYRLIGHRLDGIIGLTQAQKDRISRNLPWFPESRIHVVHNYIDAEALRATMLDRSAAREALGLDRSAFVFGCIARFDTYKRITDLLQAFALIKDEAPDAQLVIIGDGKEGADLRQEARQLGLGDRVRFTGFMPGASRYMRAFDVFVLPSEGDNFARVFLEAAAADLPIIGVAGGGTPEVLGDPTTVAPARDPQRLAEALATLMTSSDDYRQARAETLRAGFNARFTEAKLRTQMRHAMSTSDTNEQQQVSDR